MSPALKFAIVLAVLAVVWTVLGVVIYIGKLRVRGLGKRWYITRMQHPHLFWPALGIMAVGVHTAVAVLIWVLYYRVE
ncbi:MAG: hypothetical protein SNJ75_17215 [Gemmataceae bacterium]